MDYEQLKIDNQMCFALYTCSREIIRGYKPLLDELGITYTQYIVLMVLWEKDNITVKALGERLYLDSGTLTPLLKKLEMNEIIKRTRDKTDERNVFISLTDKGTALKDKAKDIPEKLLCSTRISLEDAVELREKLKALIKHLRKDI